MKIELLEKDLMSMARAYGKIYDIGFGEVAYTNLVAPESFLLQTPKDESLRYYMYRAKDSIWEHVYGASTIIHDGMPIAKELIDWQIGKAIELGVEGATKALQEAADIGSHVHKATELLLLGKSVNMSEYNARERWCVISFANFLNDVEIQNCQTEQIVGYDQAHDIAGRKLRVVYAGTVDLICEIYNPKLEKWETWLIDYKTSKEAYLSHRIQVTGYAAAAVMSGRVPQIDRRGVLLLGKRTVKGYQLVEVGKERNWPINFVDFLNVYHSFMMVNGGKPPAPRYKVFPITLKVEGKTDVEMDKETSQAKPKGVQASPSNNKNKS